MDEKSKQAKRAVRKGKRGEKRTADLFRKALEGCDKVEVIQRNQGKWSGKRNPEIAIVRAGDYNDHLIHIENKRDKKRSLLAAYRQAERDAKPGAIPIAVCKRDREDEIVIIMQNKIFALSVGHPKYSFYLRVALLESTKETSNKSLIPIGVYRGIYPTICALWLRDFLPMVRAWADRLDI